MTGPPPLFFSSFFSSFLSPSLALASLFGSPPVRPRASGGTTASSAIGLASNLMFCA